MERKGRSIIGAFCLRGGDFVGAVESVVVSVGVDGGGGGVDAGVGGGMTVSTTTGAGGEGISPIANPGIWNGG